MSDQKHRCLNCGTELLGDYCYQCGQKNKDFQLSFFKLIKSFFDEITFFDNKIINTLKYLAYKPAYLTQSYLNGQRVRFVPPFRLYLFLSSVFFIIGFSDFDNDIMKVNDKSLSELQESLKANDSITKVSLKQQKDSFELSLKPNQKDGWWTKRLKEKSNDIYLRYRDSKDEFIPDLAKVFEQKFPYLLYLSLPVVALFLWLFYWKKTKRLYVDHFIFTLYLFSSIFLYLLLESAIEFVLQLIVSKPISLKGIVIWLLEAYTFLALYLFYKQGLLKCFLKFILLNLLLVIFSGILIIMFLLLSVFSM